MAKKKMSDAVEFNRKAQWKAYKQLQGRAEKAWKKFRSDIAKGAGPDVLLKDQHNLLLLLGECNYMVREYTQFSKRR